MKQMAKRSIDFTKRRTELINELINLMGIKDTYGEIPKAIDFGVTLAINTIKHDSNVIPTLNDENMAHYFNSVKNFRNKQKRQKN